MRSSSLLIVAGSAALAASTFTIPDALAICRVVNDPEDPPPQVTPDQSVLFLKRTDLEVGDCDEDPGDDAGPVDAGVFDASSGDAGPGDPIDPQQCEVIPEAVTMVVQPRFRIGEDGSSFALLMVTPSQPVISLERQDLFTELAENTSPLVEVVPFYIEDEALGYQCSDPKFASGGGCLAGGSHVSGNDFDPPPAPPWRDPETNQIEQVGPYEVARLDALDSIELAARLDELGYAYEQEDLDAIAPYLELGFVAIAVRVQIDGELSGGLQPLALTYPGTEMRLPLGISRQAELAKTNIALYVSADGRYDFPGATITYAQLQSDIETVLTRSNLAATLDQGPEGDPIAFRNPSNAPVREEFTVTQEIRIPSSKCPSPPPSDNDEGLDLCACQQTSLAGAGNGLLIFLSVVFLGFVARRRRNSR